MKEQEVRQHVKSFLKRTAREVVMPVSVGLRGLNIPSRFLPCQAR